MLAGWDYMLDVIARFRAKEMPFHEYSSWMRSNCVGDALEYEGDWYVLMDVWMETIEYCYPEEEWYELGCSLGDFIEFAIRNEPRPLKLPDNDRVVRENFRR